MAMVSLFLTPPLPSCAPWKSVKGPKHVRTTTSLISCCNNSNNNWEAKTWFPNPSDDRLLEKAFKEPVAFMGGIFAGLLRLDLNEDPLKEWVTRTVEASGITTDEEEIDPQSGTPQPQQIQID